ncbi:hypothetical protein MTO96_048402 [Rhipicephalus appendiculatus]
MEHIFRDCPADPPPKRHQEIVSSQNWETLLASHAPDVQVRVTCKEPKRSPLATTGGAAVPITPSVRLLPNLQRHTFLSSLFQPHTMAPPFQPIRSALHFWMRTRARNDESASDTEQDWWPLRSNAKSGSRTPPSPSRSSGQWSSVAVTDEASSGAATSRQGSSSHGSVQRSNSVESDADSSVELTDRGSKESLVRGGTPWQGLQNSSQYIRAPAIACIVFVGAFATAMVVKSAFEAFSGEENAEFASDPPVHLQLPSRPLQPDDSGPSVKFSHRSYNGTARRGRFVPRKESSVATTAFSTVEPDETSGTKSLLLDTVSPTEASSRTRRTRKRSRKFSENDGASSITTKVELSVGTSNASTSTVSQSGDTATTSGVNQRRHSDPVIGAEPSPPAMVRILVSPASVWNQRGM